MLKKNSEIEEKLNVCKDVQWLYEIKNDDWKSFPLYINSVIESAYSKKQLHVSPNLLIKKIKIYIIFLF
jgi:hypothetical protein